MIWSLAILIVTSIACSIVGVFLVLRQLSMVTDAISHTILLGIILGYFVVHDVASPMLIIFATAFGLLSVFCIEILLKTGLVQNDAAIGIIFPLFFAIAVILISMYARNVHIDVDVVLMGEVIFAPLNKLILFGVGIPKALIQMSVVLIINLLFVVIFYKELKISTFDSEFAKILGFNMSIIHYSLMTLVSFTAVSAFDVVGAILVISFFIVPAASAYLVTKKLSNMIIVAMLYGVVNSILGYIISVHFNVSMSGMCAFIAIVTFFLTFVFNSQGYITKKIMKVQKKAQFERELFILHLGNHKDDVNELGIDSIRHHLKWSETKLKRHVDKLVVQGYIITNPHKKMYRLTDEGEKYHKILCLEYNL